MKKLSILGFFIFALLTFNSCETEDDVVFVANQGEFSFTNSFSPQYILTPLTSSNLAERFTWNTPDLGVPTNISYQLQKSIIGDFSDAETVGATSSNEIALTVGDMLVYASQLGLDADSGTEAPNVGNVTFRLRAVVGDNSLETFSSTQSLTLELLESTDVVAVCEFDQLYAVGAGLPTAGWDWATPVVFNCTGNGVYSGNVELTNEGDANFRFFTVNTDWGSGRNYPYYADAGYTIDANFENAADGDSNFKFIGASGLYSLEIDDINKTITLGEPQASGTCEVDVLYGVGAGLPTAGWDWATPVELYCSSDGVWSGNVTLQNNGGADNNFRFFTVNTDWGSGRNYPYYADEGYTIDANLVNAMDGDSNFAFVGTSGTYFLTIDTVNKVITLE
jgi:starch-binding outer membrane protein SusE/F